MDFLGRKKLEIAQREGRARISVVEGLENYLGSLDDHGRKQYISNVAGFFPNILKPQLLSMIIEQKNTLARFGLLERETDILRSNINCFQLLLEWGERCVNEHVGNIEETRQRARADQNIISDLRTKYENGS